MLALQVGGFLPGDEPEAATPAADTEQAAGDGEETLPPVLAAGRCVVDAWVVPATAADLSFPVGGIVDDVLVDEGDTVAAGDVLIPPQHGATAAPLSAAPKPKCGAAQARFDELKAGPRAGDRLARREPERSGSPPVARAGGARCRARRRRPKPRLAGAQAGLDKVLEGARARNS